MEPRFELVALRAQQEAPSPERLVGSQPIEDSPRRPEATRGNGTQRDSRSTAVRRHRQPHRSAPPRDRENNTEGPTRDFLDTRGRSLGMGHQRVRDHPQRVPWPREPNIADEIRERRAGTNIVGVIALNTGTACAASGPHDRRSSEPAADG